MGITRKAWGYRPKVQEKKWDREQESGAHSQQEIRFSYLFYGVNQIPAVKIDVLTF